MAGSSRENGYVMPDLIKLERFIPATADVPEGWRIARFTWCGKYNMAGEWFEVAKEGDAPMTMKAKVIVPTKLKQRRVRRREESALVTATRKALRS